MLKFSQDNIGNSHCNDLGTYILKIVYDGSPPSTAKIESKRPWLRLSFTRQVDNKPEAADTIQFYMKEYSPPSVTDIKDPHTL